MFSLAAPNLLAEKSVVFTLQQHIKLQLFAEAFDRDKRCELVSGGTTSTLTIDGSVGNLTDPLLCSNNSIMVCNTISKLSQHMCNPIPHVRLAVPLERAPLMGIIDENSLLSLNFDALPLILLQPGLFPYNRLLLLYVPTNKLNCANIGQEEVVLCAALDTIKPDLASVVSLINSEFFQRYLLDNKNDFLSLYFYLVFFGYDNLNERHRELSIHLRASIRRRLSHLFNNSNILCNYLSSLGRPNYNDFKKIPWSSLDDYTFRSVLVPTFTDIEEAPRPDTLSVILNTNDLQVIKSFKTPPEAADFFVCLINKKLCLLGLSTRHTYTNPKFELNSISIDTNRADDNFDETKLFVIELPATVLRAFQRQTILYVNDPINKSNSKRVFNNLVEFDIISNFRPKLQTQTPKNNINIFLDKFWTPKVYDLRLFQSSSADINHVVYCSSNKESALASLVWNSVRYYISLDVATTREFQGDDRTYYEIPLDANFSTVLNPPENTLLGFKPLFINKEDLYLSVVLSNEWSKIPTLFSLDNKIDGIMVLNKTSPKFLRSTKTIPITVFTKSNQTVSIEPVKFYLDSSIHISDLIEFQIFNWIANNITIDMAINCAPQIDYGGGQKFFPNNLFFFNFCFKPVMRADIIFGNLFVLTNFEYCLIHSSEMRDGNQIAFELDCFKKDIGETIYIDVYSKGQYANINDGNLILFKVELNVTKKTTQMYSFDYTNFIYHEI